MQVELIEIPSRVPLREKEPLAQGSSLFPELLSAELFGQTALEAGPPREEAAPSRPAGHSETSTHQETSPPERPLRGLAVPASQSEAGESASSASEKSAPERAGSSTSARAEDPTHHPPGGESVEAAKSVSLRAREALLPGTFDAELAANALPEKASRGAASANRGEPSDGAPAAKSVESKADKGRAVDPSGPVSPSRSEAKAPSRESATSASFDKADAPPPTEDAASAKAASKGDTSSTRHPELPHLARAKDAEFGSASRRVTVPGVTQSPAPPEEPKSPPAPVSSHSRESSPGAKSVETPSDAKRHSSPEPFAAPSRNSGALLRGARPKEGGPTRVQFGSSALAERILDSVFRGEKTPRPPALESRAGSAPALEKGREARVSPAPTPSSEARELETAEPPSKPFEIHREAKDNKGTVELPRQARAPVVEPREFRLASADRTETFGAPSTRERHEESRSSLESSRASSSEPSSRPASSSPSSFNSPQPEAAKPLGLSNPQGGQILAQTSRAIEPGSSTPSFVRPRELMLRVAPGFDAALARMAREFLAHGETRLKVALDPPRLGALEVRLTVSESHASARIVAASPEAANLLAREREDLVRAFQAQGFGSVSVEISSGEESRGFSRGRDGDTEDGKGEGVPAPRIPEILRARTPPAARAGGLDLFV